MGPIKSRKCSNNLLTALRIRKNDGFTRIKNTNLFENFSNFWMHFQPEIAKKIVEVTANTTFVAHNAAFDYSFVREEFKRLGYDYKRKTMCTVSLSRKLVPGLRSYSLGNICRDLNITIEGRHRAGQLPPILLCILRWPCPLHRHDQ